MVEKAEGSGPAAVAPLTTVTAAPKDTVKALGNVLPVHRQVVANRGRLPRRGLSGGSGGPAARGPGCVAGCGAPAYGAGCRPAAVGGVDDHLPGPPVGSSGRTNARGCREPCHVMRPGRTRVAGRRAGLVRPRGDPPQDLAGCRIRANAGPVIGEGGVCVEVLDVFAQHDVKVAWPGDQKLSRHSRRSVPMKRSMIAFARGARIGVRMIRMSAPVSTASNAAVNL